MRPDLVLGFDPAPADLEAAERLRETLRAVVRGLVQARTGLDGLGRTGSVWDGPAGAPIAALLRRYSQRLSALEHAVVDCLHGLDVWREGAAGRQEQVAQLTVRVADLAGAAGTEGARGRLLAAAREVGDEHDRAAGDLAATFEELSVAMAAISSGDDLPGDLDRALLGLTAAVEDWIRAEGPALLRTAIALGEVAGLTTVISELVGLAALGRHPDQTSGVGEIIARSPGSHRLIRALRQQWAEVAPPTLPEATFTDRGGLSAAIAGRPRPDRAGRPGAGRTADGDTER